MCFIFQQEDWAFLYFYFSAQVLCWKGVGRFNLSAILITSDFDGSLKGHIERELHSKRKGNAKQTDRRGWTTASRLPKLRFAQNIQHYIVGLEVSLRRPDVAVI